MVRGGLVGGIRGKVWMEASGAASKLESNPKLYSQLIEDDDSLSLEESQASEAIGQIEVPCLSVCADGPTNRWTEGQTQTQTQTLALTHKL